MKVAFIGLGTMGYPMAGHLQLNGLDTTVFNRTMSKSLAWQQQYKGKVAQTPKEACEQAEIVMLCVGNDNDLREVCFGPDGVLTGLAPNGILIDHTTTSVEVAKEIAAALPLQDQRFLDAPVSGGEIGAQKGELTIMVGGDKQSLEKVHSALSCYAQSINLLGAVGAGQTCKMVNQICIAGILQGMSEGLALAKQSGLDLVQVKDVLKHGAAQSWQLEQRTETISMDKFDFGFAIDWMRKDLNICLNQAQQLGIDTPLVKLVDASYEQLQKQGYNRCDTSILVKSIMSKDQS
ncbi:NAD(P)-dependent oxidoreductase [Paraglaciecola sp. 2405UD69-4]|uniref:NAD(P)-dependent oxidoreductase n=1 Tax=Paraglaciecola sp. 2405UD69-4 TaxID=3391836 RepID=UPI0039C8D9F4